MQPLKRLPAGALKRMKIKFLLPFTMNTEAQFWMPPNLLVETNTYDQRILTAAVVSGSIDPGGPIDSQTETATVYSSSTHISSLTPWKPRSKTLAFTKCTHYFPKHLVYLLLKLTFFFSRRPATPCSLTWELSHLRLDALLVSSGNRESTVIKYNLSVAALYRFLYSEDVQSKISYITQMNVNSVHC